MHGKQSKMPEQTITPELDDRIQQELKAYARLDRDEDAIMYINSLMIPSPVKIHYNKLYTIMSETYVKRQTFLKTF